MCSTFILFPLLGVLFAWWAPVNVDPMLYSGFIYLCILPATVQSGYHAFTSLAGGNASRLRFAQPRPPACWGSLFPPLLVGVLMNLHGAGGSLEQVGKIMLRCCCLSCSVTYRGRGLATGWRSIRSGLVETDQTSILLVVYSAFERGGGEWHLA
ncbi:bile acid:sodium symporter [Klebsiella pneumoniae subsp. pneumoniae]|nr:bile acid:sodium symporter [Klebsiella pneumoniae subsp. pneumoniae]